MGELKKGQSGLSKGLNWGGTAGTPAPHSQQNAFHSKKKLDFAYVYLHLFSLKVIKF